MLFLDSVHLNKDNKEDFIVKGLKSYPCDELRTLKRWTYTKILFLNDSVCCITLKSQILDFYKYITNFNPANPPNILIVVFSGITLNWLFPSNEFSLISIKP